MARVRVSKRVAYLSAFVSRDVCVCVFFLVFCFHVSAFYFLFSLFFFCFSFRFHARRSLSLFLSKKLLLLFAVACCLSLFFFFFFVLGSLLLEPQSPFGGKLLGV